MEEEVNEKGMHTQIEEELKKQFEGILEIELVGIGNFSGHMINAKLIRQNGILFMDQGKLRHNKEELAEIFKDYWVDKLESVIKEIEKA